MTATYSPEDNKLRLYVGRVSREEFLALRKDGWAVCSKQREMGGADFAAPWTPSRRDTALEYGDGVIEDEDQPMAERAADRAERFGGYRDKRLGEATGHADNYDAGPSVHGNQSQARAERSAARHDRIADRACDSWSKAEYWTQRTAGVIAHALHKSSPGVRMGRIKELEAQLRKQRANLEEYSKLWSDLKKIEAITDPAKQTAITRQYLGSRNVWAEYLHPRAATHPREYYRTNKVSLHSLISDEQDAITGAEACALFFSDHSEPDQENDWTLHLTLRLAYENQMLEAQGGRLEQKEIEVGGKIGGKLIIKANRSSVTKRITSVDLLGPKVQGWNYRASNITGTEWAAYTFDTERLNPNDYTAPTPESLKELEEYKAAVKAGKPAKATLPLINPTVEDAERLQAVWNERARAKHEQGNIYSSPEARASHTAQFKPSTVCHITQAVYSANSKGTYARAETRGLHADCQLSDPHSDLYSPARQERRKRIGPSVCTLRTTGGDGAARRVIVLTDKPQKPLPASVWEPLPAQPEPITV